MKMRVRNGPGTVAFILILVIVQYDTVSTIAIDNEVQGDPIIECGDSSLTFSIKTKKLFAGRIFVKGKTTDVSCVRTDFAKQTTSMPVFDLSFGSCGMRGQRAEEPRGMYYTVTLVVSFHPMFLTKVDRAYHVKCFFEEALKTLTAGIDVSMFSTAEVTAFRTSTGTCTYTIHQGTTSGGLGPNSVGPQISVAQVGDKIVHKWECTDPMYGILVRSCYVTDGFGTQAEVIDRHGCPVDPVLISGISYDASLTEAFAESHVFKFADRPGVWFYCQVQLCLKMSQACDGVTPPSCAVMPTIINGTEDPTMPPWYTRTSPSNATFGTRPLETGATPLPTASPSGSATNQSSTIAVIPRSHLPPDNGVDAGSTPAPPPGFSTRTMTTHSRLPPAPPWSSANGSGLAAEAANVAPNQEAGPKGTSLPAANYINDNAKAKKKLLFRQHAELARVSATTAPSIYEEEQLIYDEFGPENGSSTDQAPSVVLTTAASESDAMVVTGIRRWRRPTSTAGSVDRAVVYRAHRRSTASDVRSLVVKRSAISARGSDRGSNDETISTRRYREIEKKIHRPARDENKKRQQEQQHVLQQQQRKKLSNAKENAEVENENLFTYRDSELSNRLIIFDVDEDPPPGYMHWSRNIKKTANAGADDEAMATRHSESDTGSSRTGDASPKHTAIDGCVVSAQGLIMILTASGSVSAFLVILLAAVCFRYRVISSRKLPQNYAAPRPSHTGVMRRAEESEDRERRVVDVVRWQEHQRATSSTNMDATELSRLPRPHERRKQR